MVGGITREVKYKGLPFTIEVEDKGHKRACIETKIFFRGSLLVHEEISYADILKFEKLEKVVRELIFELYRKAYNDLQTGKYDEKIKHLISSLKERERERKKEKKPLTTSSVVEFIEKRVIPELAQNYADKYITTKIWDLVKSRSLKSYAALPEREKFILLCRDIFTYLPEQIADEERDNKIMNWLKELTNDEKDNY